MIACNTDRASLDLHAQGDIKIFGNVALRPIGNEAVLFDDTDVLNGRPADEGIVADKGGDFTRADGKSDGGVHHVGKEGDTILEVVLDDLHDAGGVLDDGDLRGEEHLGCAVEETVDGLHIVS